MTEDRLIAAALLAVIVLSILYVWADEVYDVSRYVSALLMGVLYVLGLVLVVLAAAAIAVLIKIVITG